MIRTPNPDRLKIKQILLLAILALTQTFAMAAESVHHYVINKPIVAVVGEDCKISITACRVDGTLISDARNKFKFYMSSSKGLESKDLQLRDGEAEVNFVFKSAENIILQVVDKNNPDLSTSDLMQVKTTHQIKKRGGQ